MNVGVIVRLHQDIEAEIKKVHDFGMKSCQLNCWDMTMYTPELAERVVAACKQYDVTVSSVWAGYSGPKVWDFVSGPLTLGLLPEAYRSQRVEDLKRGSDFAEMIGCDQVITHVGFIPENLNEVAYNGMIVALREVAKYMQKKGQKFLFETGQETPVTMLRAFEDIGTDNLGVNLDPANLILYGKGNPVDALHVLGKYIMDVHGKDGKYPTNGRELGDETALGQGHVDYPALIKGLKACGYTGPITIEREISGEKQIEDIKMAKEILEKLIAEA
ncbi:MAG: TIM barrel protein [Clostridia bacterium]|nr:TIM barrel protein [Clostridia bacterium]